MSRLLEKPEPVIDRTAAPQPVTRPKMVPWQVKRQMLEAEDREKAKALRNAATPDPSIEKLEEELNVAESTREAEGSNTANT